MGRKFRINWLFCAQVVAHLSVVPMVIYGQWYHYLISIGVYFLTGCLGMSMTFHRLLSHRSWQAPLWFETVGSVLGTVGLTGSTLAWCAVHREHHWNADKPKDPHSPLFQSVFRVQFLSMFHRPRIRYMKDLLRAPLHLFLHRRYWLIQLVVVMALYFLLEPFAVVYAYLFPACILWNAGSLINTMGHIFGYQTYPTRDASKNNLLLGYCMWGEGWHNNHHMYQKSPYFGRAWWELDLSGLFIRLLRVDKKASDHVLEPATGSVLTSGNSYR